MTNNITKPLVGDFIHILSQDGYHLNLGLSEKNINELVKYSKDKSDISLQIDTSDISRFSSEEKYKSWYNDEGRYVYSLNDGKGDLVGIWWGRPCKLPKVITIENNLLYNKLLEKSTDLFTNGIRIYPKFRGKGLAKLLLEAQKHLYKIFPYAVMCIDINKDNIPSQKSYQRSGYQLLGEGENKKTVNASINSRLLFIRFPH